MVRKPDSSVELTITASGEFTQEAYNKACDELSRKVEVPGFRKGTRLPPDVLENHLGTQTGEPFALRANVIESIVNKVVESALRDDHGLDPVGTPKMVTPVYELAKTFKPGESIDIVIDCDVWPDFAWKESDLEKPYYGLEGKYKRKPPNQEFIDMAVNDLRDRYATLEPTDDGHALQMGDACTVNMNGFFVTDDGVSKGDPLPGAASGDSVEVILGQGRYMPGLVEGLVGGKAGETKPVYTSFPTALKDKSLAGKKVVFDVEIISSSIRTLPEVNDEFANKVQAGMTAEKLMTEIQKAIDKDDAEDYTEDRNRVLSKGLAERIDMEVPDSLITTKVSDKYANMMAEMRTNGMADEDLKLLITPESFEKYKKIEAPDAIADFKVSRAVDEIAAAEGISVTPESIENQVQLVKKSNKDQAPMNPAEEKKLRQSIEVTLLRREVMDLLADNSKLEVEYVDEGAFDQQLMDDLADSSLQREIQAAATQEETEKVEEPQS
eukprot:CAMPEP_0118700294 /NCGR_PEP_ID=MMETSP0800-20121206/16482_1 /TAXON_ID=210618 ORGANISM="Striatella unipunctata, Strain CCMP2910" /NCGR_SAMPLE_ID=MMETSP0800 /ASSEMBLY_ACC=CAM_ASM_000638 /LENGTH=495 /DNA_ID=CAMNT_0006600821 /DNA_START=261 /DNA_END=1748 /DNA_ORIENTATION=-